MRYAARRKQDISVSTTPLEVVIPLEQPITIYSAKELAAMPLSVMNAAIEAQERFYQLEELTHMGGASYYGSSPYGEWTQADSSKGKVTYTLQDQQRIYSTKNYSSVGNARISEIGSKVA
ncbi:hypothetical protein EA763_00290 [Acinetobacter lactucae]|nr:hypothetical protein EA763_00290 [Acinetobacter lactucae]